VRKEGLPGLTPAKKVKEAVKSGAIPMNGLGGGPSPSQGPGPYAAYRLKLQSAYCPTASPEDKLSTACKSYEISRQMRSASAEQKKALTDQRTKMFQEVSTKSEAEKKAAGAAAKALYTRMFAHLCTGSKVNSEPACTDNLMKKMYGGPATKTPASKPAKH